jgi:hypothetical protein
MQRKSRRQMQVLEDQPLTTQSPTRFGWTTFVHAPARHRSAISRFSNLVLPNDKTITISVIGGPSKGLRYQLTKPLISIGRTGGGADIEIDDPKIYPACVVSLE